MPRLAATIIDSDDAPIDPCAEGLDVFDDRDGGVGDFLDRSDAGSLFDTIANVATGGAYGATKALIGAATSGSLSGIEQAIGGDFSQASQYLSDLGSAVADGYQWADSEYRAFDAYAKKAIAALGPVLPLIETGLSLVPGFGTAAAAALAGGVALLEGQSLSAAMLSAAKAAIPGGPEIAMAFDLAQSIGQGKGWDAVALQAGRDAIEEELGPEGVAAFDEATAIGYGVYKTAKNGGNVGRYLGGVGAKLADDAAKAIASGHPDLAGFIQQAKNIEKIQPGAMKASNTVGDPKVPSDGSLAVAASEVVGGARAPAQGVVVAANPNGGPATVQRAPGPLAAFQGRSIAARSGVAQHLTENPAILAALVPSFAEATPGPGARQVRAIGVAPIAIAADLPVNGPSLDIPDSSGVRVVWRDRNGNGQIDAGELTLQRGNHRTNKDARMRLAAARHRARTKPSGVGLTSNARRFAMALLSASRLRALPLRSVALIVRVPTAAARAGAAALLASADTGRAWSAAPEVEALISLDRSFDDLIKDDAGAVAMRSSPSRGAPIYRGRGSRGGRDAGSVGGPGITSTAATQDRLLAYTETTPGAASAVSPPWSASDVDGIMGPRTTAMLAAYNQNRGFSDGDTLHLADEFPNGAADTADIGSLGGSPAFVQTPPTQPSATPAPAPAPAPAATAATGDPQPDRSTTVATTTDDSSSSSVPWILGGLAVVSAAAILWASRRKKKAPK